MASRINTRFAVLVGAIIVAVALGVFLLMKMRENPATFLAKAEAAYAEGEMGPAVMNLNKAFNRETDDAKRIAILKRMVEVYEEMPPRNVSHANEIMRNILMSYNRALQLDESDLWASENLLDYAFAQARRYGRSDNWNALYMQADQLLKFVPDHKKATYFRAIAGTMRITQRTLGTADIKQAREDLDRALKLFPDDGKLVYYDAMWYFNEARKAEELNEHARVKGIREFAFNAVDEFIKKHPEDVDARLGRARLTLSLAVGRNREAVYDDAKAQLTELEALLLKGGDPLSTREVAGRLRMLDTEMVTLEDGRQTTSGLQRAERLLRVASKKNPDNLEMQILLADNLSQQAQVDEALAVLGETKKDRPLSLSVESANAVIYRAEAMRRMADLYFRKSSMATSDEEGQQNKQAIESLITELDGMVEGSRIDRGYVELLRGKLALHNNEAARAKVHLLKADKSLVPAISSNAQLMLYDLYRRSGDTGAAAEYLTKAMESDQRTNSNPRLHLDMAKMLIDSNQFDSAIERLEWLDEMSPNNPDVLIAMSRARINKSAMSDRLDGDRTKAVQEAMDSLAPLDHSKNRQLVLFKAMLLGQLDRGDEAVAMIEKFYADHPRDFEILAHLVRAHRQLGEAEKADTLVDEALAKYPDETRLRALKVQSTEEMIEIAEELYTRDADEVRKQIKLYAYHNQLGNEEKAKAALAKAIELDPDHPDVLRTRFALALAERDWDGAEALFATAKAMNDGQGIDFDGGDSWRGNLLYAQGKYDEAEAALESAQDKQPKDSRIALLLGRTRLALGNMAGAERAVQFSLAMRPNNAEGWLLMHQIHDHLQRHDKALQDLRNALKNEPQNRALYNRYLTYMGQHGDIDQAIEMRQRQIENKPDDVGNQVALGQLYLNASRFDDAQKVFETINKKDPDQFSAVYGLATVLRAKGQADEGARLLRQFIDAHTDEPKEVYWTTLGQYLLAIRDSQGAEAAYRKAVELDGENAAAALQELAGFYFANQRFPEAASHYAQLLKKLEGDTGIDDDTRSTVLGNYARSLSLAGQLDRAEQVVAEMLAEWPDDTDTMLLQIAFWYKRLQDEAIPEPQKAGIRTKLESQLNEAVSLAKANPKPYLQRARYYFNSDDEIVMAEVRDDLDRARTLDPSRIETREMLAQWHLKRNDVDSAVQELRGLISVRPRYRAARLSLTRLCLQESRMAEADMVLSDAIRQFPNEPLWYEWRGRKHQMNRDMVAAERDLAKAYEIDRNVSRFVQYGGALLANGKHDAFLTELRNYPEALSQSSLMQAMRARALVATGKTTEGLNAFGRALTLAGQKTDQVSPVLAQLNAAADAKQRLGVIEPFLAGDRTGRLALSAVQCYMALDQYDQALEMLKALESRFEAGTTNLLQTQQLLAKAMYDLERFEESRKYYEIVIAAQPNNLMALNNIAYILADELDNPQAALQHARSAEQLTANVSDLSQRANILDTLGYVQYRLDQYSDAEQTLRRSVGLVSLPANHLHLAKVLIAQGRDLAAKEELRKARELCTEKTENKVKAEIDTLLRELEEAPATSER